MFSLALGYVSLIKSRIPVPNCTDQSAGLHLHVYKYVSTFPASSPRVSTEYGVDMQLTPYDVQGCKYTYIKPKGGLHL
jgi:hypothetical protein